jgi:hypothetical protein
LIDFERLARTHRQKDQLAPHRTAFGAGIFPQKIAAELNQRKVPTTRGGTWQAITVSNMIKRGVKMKAV